MSVRRILVSNSSVTCNSHRELLHVGLVSACLSSSVKSMKSSAASCLEIHNPIVVYLMSRTKQVAMFYRASHTS